MVFELLNKDLQKIVAKKFTQPTLTQQVAIKPILEGKNVLLIAPVGTGKCISGDSLTFTNYGLQKADSLNTGRVNTLEKSKMKIEIKPGFLTKKDINPMLKITTRHGYSIKTTFDHKFLMLDGWKEANKLKIGDFVATVRKWYIESNILPEFNLIPKKYATSSKPINIKLTPNFAYFVGAFIGDGSYNRVGGIRFTIKNLEILDKISVAMKELGLKVKKYKNNEYRIDSYLLKTFLEQNGMPDIKIGKKGGKSKNVFISNLFLKIPSQILSELISGIFDTDGWVEKTQICIISSSEQLIKTLQFALLRFGIISQRKIRKKNYKNNKNVYFYLVVSDRNSLNIFYKEIGFKIRYKQEKLYKIINVNKKFNPNIDVIPLTKEFFIQLKKELNPKWKKHSKLEEYMYENEYPSRYGLEKLIKELEVVGNSPSLNKLRVLADSDVLWDRIMSIEKVDEEIVYDFTIPETENFVAEGFVLHNTESAMLPLFNFVMEQKTDPISILYITPLKALNRNLLDRLLWWCNEIDIEVSVRHGDTSQYERRMQTEFPPQLLITTPETLQAVLPGKRIKEHLRNVKWCVLDDCHEIVDSKRGTQLAIALERLKELCGHDFQIIMLSATVGDPEKVANFFAGGRPIEIIKSVSVKEMKIEVVNPKSEPRDKRIGEKVFTSTETAARLRFIMDMIKKSRSVLTFTNTREFAEILASRIKTLDKDFLSGVHHSSLSKEVRIKAEKEFKDEKIKSIISTSSLQLGIDIGSVDLVLQYMSPRTISQLIQRVGRSGHESKKIARGIIITTDEDDIFESTVIARKALAEEIEQQKFHENAFDVLAHQIVGLTLDYWKIDQQKAYEIIKRAYPYRNLSFTEFLEVCKQLQSLGLVFLNGHVKKKQRGLEYYYSNLSTIPDQKSYSVINTLDRSFVGVLDEEFVALHGEQNTTFIVKGEAWKIIDVQEDNIFVEPVEDVEAAVPGWEGELIPVPFDVAQEVGQVRRKIKEGLQKKDEQAVVEDLRLSYPVDANSARKMINAIKKQMEYGIVPDDRTILVEDFENTVILHACFGSLVNETLGRFLSALLTARLGSVGLKTDPYRITLEFQAKSIELIKEILLKTNPELLRSYIEMSLTKNTLFEWKFVHVAKRFGAIARNAEYGRVRMGRIIDSYIGSPMYKETLKELETEKLDIEKTTEILGRLQKNDIKIIFKPGLSPLGKSGIKHKYAEVVGPERPEKEIFELFKNRLMNSKIRLACVNCGQWSQVFTINDIPKGIKCKKCEAKLLGIVSPANTEILKIIKKKLRETGITGEESKKFERVRKAADLFLVYEQKAAIAMAGRGVGPTTASRILAKFHKTEDDFLKDILEAERNYLRTKKYWSS